MNKIDEKFKIDITSIYEKQELLAKNYLGVYGLVYKAMNKKTSEGALLKEIDLTGIPQSGRQEIYKEAIFLSSLQHENFLKFLGYQELKDKLLYVLEYPDELLSDYCQEKKEITNSFLHNLITSILKSIQFLEKNIGYGMGRMEVTLDNIVILKSGMIKLCDVIECLKIIKNIRIEQGFSSEDNKGFYPPEEFSLNSMIQKGSSPEFKSMIFSLGMIVCKLIDDEAFYNFIEGRMVSDSQENLNLLLVKIKEKVPIEIFEVLMLMTNFDPKLRHDVNNLLNFLKPKEKIQQKKDENCFEELNNLKETLKKKDKDIFILKDQLRVANEQNQKLAQENEKIRTKSEKIGTEKEIIPTFFLSLFFFVINIFFFFFFSHKVKQPDFSRKSLLKVVAS